MEAREVLGFCGGYVCFGLEEEMNVCYLSWKRCCFLLGSC